MQEDILTFGSETQKDLLELKKALEVGYGVSPSTQTGFGATRVESLEKTLKYATEEEKMSKFWKDLKKSKGTSTIEEFTTVNQLGSAGFYPEGGLPEEYDEDIRREFESVKYIGAQGKVPNVARNVKSIANNVALIQKLKAIAIIRASDYKSFFGDAGKLSMEWNGVLAQFNNRVKDKSQHVIDLQGKVLNEQVLAQVGQIIQDYYGDPENIKGWISNGAFRHYAEELIKTKTYFVNGQPVRAIESVPKRFALGDASGLLETDIHLKFKGQSYIGTGTPHPKLNSDQTASVATSTKAPATLDASHCSVAEDTGGSLSAGTYEYMVIPVNMYGAGAGFELTITIANNNAKAVFTVSDNNSPAGQEAELFEVWRKVDGTAITDYRFVDSFKAGTTVVDDGSEIPGTEYGFFFDWNQDQVIDFKQLLPMVKMPLAIIDDSIRWLQKLYGTPIVYNPNKIVVVKNIGTQSWS